MEQIPFPFDTEELFDKCVKNKVFPKNDFKKQAVLLKLLDEFEDNKKYSEQEVGEIIKKYFDDFTTIRRELINFGYMQRNNVTGEYWVVKRILTKEDIQKNTILRKHAEAFMDLD